MGTGHHVLHELFDPEPRLNPPKMITLARPLPRTLLANHTKQDGVLKLIRKLESKTKKKKHGGQADSSRRSSTQHAARAGCEWRRQRGCGSQAKCPSAPRSRRRKRDAWPHHADAPTCGAADRRVTWADVADRGPSDVQRGGHSLSSVAGWSPAHRAHRCGRSTSTQTSRSNRPLARRDAPWTTSASTTTSASAPRA